MKYGHLDPFNSKKTHTRNKSGNLFIFYFIPHENHSHTDQSATCRSFSKFFQNLSSVCAISRTFIQS